MKHGEQKKRKEETKNRNSLSRPHQCATKQSRQQKHSTETWTQKVDEKQVFVNEHFRGRPKKAADYKADLEELE